MLLNRYYHRDNFGFDLMYLYGHTSNAQMHINKIKTNVTKNFKKFYAQF